MLSNWYTGNHPDIGVGHIDNGLTISPVQFILDLDFTKSMKFLEPPVVNKETMGIEDILEIGFGRRVLKILEDEGLSYEHIPSGIDNISVILEQRQLNNDVENRTIQRIKSELDVNDVTVEHNLALIMIVGEGMMHSVGISARATRAFAKAQVNIVFLLNILYTVLYS